MTQRLTKKSLTPLYCLHQAVYFFAMAGVGAFAVTYLSGFGFNAAQIGVMVASTNILSCVLQPMIGSYVDKTSVSILQKIIPVCLIVSFASLLSIELLTLARAVTGALYIVGYLTFSITIPLCNSLCAYYARHGCSVDYGAGSGVGSLSFSFASLGFGYIIALLGSGAMMAVVLVCLVLQLILVQLYPRVRASAPAVSAAAPKNANLSIPAFCLRYRFFMLTMLGVLLLAACHAMAENYLIRIFEGIGGGSEHVGVALFLACITAAPFMIFFERIQRRINVTVLMRLAGVFYIIKAVSLIFADSIMSVYLIELLQTFTYGFLYPSLYYLVIRRIDSADMAKGQSLASAMFTLGMAMGSSLGGIAIEAFGLSAMLAIAAAIACAGTLLVNAAITKADAFA